MDTPIINLDHPQQEVFSDVIYIQLRLPPLPVFMITS